MEAAQAVLGDFGVPPEEEQPRAVVSPPDPPEEVRSRHALIHAPFQAWCDICVRCRAHDAPHRRQPTEDHELTKVNELPVIQLDFCFIESNYY